MKELNDPMKIDTEQELVRALLHDNEAAFCKLYALYKGRLMYFALKFLKSNEFAEDIFQDVFTAVWQNRHFINPDAPFGPYVYTIMKNRILNLLADIDKEEGLKTTILGSAITIDESTEHKLAESDLNLLFQQAIDHLTPQQRKVFRLSREEMKSHKEIAQELGISVYTVQQHISDSLRVIRRYLAKYADTYVDIILLLYCLNTN